MQELAFVEFQLMTAVPPFDTVEGVAVTLTVGMGGGTVHAAAAYEVCGLVLVEPALSTMAPVPAEYVVAEV